MASTSQTFPRTLKTLRESNNIKEKREALIYIRSNAKKLKSADTIKEEQYKEICKLVIGMFTSTDHGVQQEAYDTVNVIIQEFKDHTLNLFEAMLQTNRKNRLKILKLLEVVEDSAIFKAVNDDLAINFFNDCMHTVQPNIMEWVAQTACSDNLQMLTEAENRSLSNDQKLEEEIIDLALTLLKRLYKVAAVTSDIKIQRFDTLLMDKVVTLAYMGHKRQRGPALKLLQEAITTDLVSHVRTKYSDVWSKYKATLQSTYCKRMLLLVEACEPDWANQWNISIQFLGIDLHRGAGLINNLLTIEEKAFKSTDTIIRRQAFLSWRLLVDNFALDPQELATARRIKLLCIPLNAKNSKTELIALTKLEVWWHLIIKLYKDIAKFANPVITQFLNFCFGPLGDTPLLSSKCDVVASPSKRFLKTKLAAMDALYQLLVTIQENHTFYTPVLEERLSNTITDSVFQETYKSIIHSVGEALLILSQLTEKELINKHLLARTLWTSLSSYIQETKMEGKEVLCKDVILTITELLNHASENPLIKDMFYDVILSDLYTIIKNIVLNDNILSELILKLFTAPLFYKMKKCHFHTVKCLIWLCIKPSMESPYSSNALEFLGTILEKTKELHLEHKSMYIAFQWRMIAELFIRYMEDAQSINEGSETKYNFKTIENVLQFPFAYIFLEEPKQIQDIAKVWKFLYKQFESQAKLIATIKPNDILLDTAKMMQSYTTKKESCSLITHCLDILLSGINYKCLLVQDEIPSIVQLITDLIISSYNNQLNAECEVVLKALSAMLIIVYGHDPEKVVTYLATCNSAIELVLTSQSEVLLKEITNTWETIVSIFKGLNDSSNYELVLSYKEAVVKAINHSNADIGTQTLSLLDMRNKLERLISHVKKDKLSTETELIKSKKDDPEKSAKPVKIVGSFLNRKSANSKSAFAKQIDERKIPSPEPDSQEFVFIKSDLKFDVNRLTEHQKESLKRRRDDIPAMYNDLSQSCSHDTQDLQQWFDIKAKQIDEIDKIQNNQKDILTEDNNDYDANKENKLDITKVDPKIDLKAVEDSVQSTSAKHNEIPVQKSETKDRKEGKENSSTVDITPLSGKMLSVSPDEKPDSSSPDSSEPVAKKLNFESREEFPEHNDQEQPSSPSMLENNKRKNRVGTAKESTSDEKASQEIDNSQTYKTVGLRSMYGRLLKQKSFDNMEEKAFCDRSKSIKRKISSDSESEECMPQRRRRKLNSLETVNGNRRKPKKSNINQRIKTEVSRLRINMTFDSPMPTRRRSKILEESQKESNETNEESMESKELTEPKEPEESKEPKEKKQSSPNGKTNATKSMNPTFCEPLKKELRSGPLNMDHPIKKRPRRSLKWKRKEEITRDVEETVNKKVGRNKAKDDDLSKPSSSKMNSTRDTIPILSIEIKKRDRRNSSSDSNILNVKKPTRQSDISSKTSDSEKSTNNEKSHNQSDESDEIVESSQEARQSLIKINKNNQDKKSLDVPAENNNILDSSEMNITNEIPETPNESSVKEVDNDPTKNDSNSQVIDTQISEDTCISPTREIDEISQQEDEKNISAETQKNGSPTTNKSGSIGTFSSPKSNVSMKRLSKLKSYAGRAAHMLDLVTKQTFGETDSSEMKVDEDLGSRKTRSKDAEDNSTKKEKSEKPPQKELEKIGPSGSRQEKIFNNMKSADYSSPPPAKLFSNLKNDGEKISSKIEKTEQATDPIEKENEDNLSSSQEKDELPMLEWSNANPPSLTASPSASILKRQRTVAPEPDPDSATPSKRKRVSFADPPVSKKMGYEISGTESPPKTSKPSGTRGLLFRKDSPYRFKLTKSRMLQIDQEKSERVNGEQTVESLTEVDYQCEKSTEVLTKITEELECQENVSMEVDSQTSSDLTSSTEEICDSHPYNRIMIDNLAYEVEISTESVLPKSSQQTSESESQESETQQDMFAGFDVRTDEICYGADVEIKENHDASDQNNSVEPLKCNVTNDSVIDDLPQKIIKSETLEDTVDIQNLTELNSTGDEVFCEKLIRTSTKATDNMAEQDTLPVTDSIFSSLPFSQNSQGLTGVEIPQPELLDSIHPIYPELITCQEPLSSIISQLTNPLWIQHLTAYFASRSLQTIGDLAQLSEREINRIPVKGNPKVDFVKSILKHFESTRSSINVSKEDAVISEKDSCSQNVHLSSLTSPPQDVETEKVQNESLSCSTPLIRPITDTTTENLSDSSIEHFGRSYEVPIKCKNVDIEMTHDSVPSPLTIETKSVLSVSISPLNSPTLPSTRTSTQPSSSIETSKFMGDSGDRNTNSTLPGHTAYSIETRDNFTDPIFPLKPPVSTETKSVACQMMMEELLDEIDVNLVLQSAARRSTPENILAQYKAKMKHMSDADLWKETVRLLAISTKPNYNELSLKSACRSYGVNKVLLRLPGIFSSDEHFFTKVLSAYRKKIKLADCLDAFNIKEVKEAIRKKCTSSELADMLSKTLEEEDQEGVQKPLKELSSLNAMLKRMPKDQIISHTVANEELIPSEIVLDIAMQNNTPDVITKALQSQSSTLTKHIFDELWSSHFTVSRMENEPRERLLEIFKIVSSKLSQEELLDAFHEAMRAKVIKEEEK